LQRKMVIRAAVVILVAFAASVGIGSFCRGNQKLHNAHLDLAILLQPKGGLYVNTITCMVEVKVVRDSGTTMYPITLNWAWVNSEGHKYDNGKKTYKDFGVTDTLILSKSAPSGMFLDKDFFLGLDWYDDMEQEHFNSDVAQCRVN